MQGALDRLIATGNCTVILVAHRLSTVVNAHQIGMRRCSLYVHAFCVSFAFVCVFRTYMIACSRALCSFRKFSTRLSALLCLCSCLSDFLRLAHVCLTRFFHPRFALVSAVIDKGRVAECGSHAELVARGGTYAKLVARQMQKQANALDMGSSGGGAAGGGKGKKTQVDSDVIDQLVEDMDEEEAATAAAAAGDEKTENASAGSSSAISSVSPAAAK